ncbi:MAG: PTS lactose/cellobiose transporter subunit IIA [Atopobiaceae bacterium]|nr:PTS lactose/cellobiose transporter subunit IIA [Atopobiaceae bacterium]
MNELQRASFQIIAAVGEARCSYIEAVAAAEQGDFARAEELLAQGDHEFAQGHKHHFALVQREATGDPVDMTLIITHAEDQLMSAESIRIMADQLIRVYRRLAA